MRHVNVRMQKLVAREQANERVRVQSSEESYKPCPTCITHPHYTSLPVTLHRGDVCLVCFNMRLPERDDGFWF